MKRSVIGKITKKDGRKVWTPDSPRWWRFNLSKFEVGDTVTMTMTAKKPSRTLKQNALYFAYLTIIAEETGHTVNEIHEWCKGTCLPSEVKEVLGDPVRVKKSTTELNKSEFAEYLLDIEARTGIPIPDTEGYVLDSIYQGEDSKIDYPEGDLTPKF